MYIRIFLAARNHFIYTTLRGFNTFQPLDKTPFMVILEFGNIRFLFFVILGRDPSIQRRVFEWILGINPRMTEKKYLRMAMSGVFHLSLNFFKKWQKTCVKALKRSEIECLGFTERERDLWIAYFSSFFSLFLFSFSIWKYLRFNKNISNYRRPKNIIIYFIVYLLRQTAFLTKMLQRSANEIPRYLACSGTKESAVIPGLVLISNKTTPSFSL